MKLVFTNSTQAYYLYILLFYYCQNSLRFITSSGSLATLFVFSLLLIETKLRTYIKSDISSKPFRFFPIFLSRNIRKMNSLHLRKFPHFDAIEAFET